MDATLSIATARHNAERIDRFLRLLEAEDFEAWSDLFAEHAVQESPYAPAGFPPRFVGKREILEHYAQLPNAFESMRFPGLVVHQTIDPLVAIAEYRGDIRLRGSPAKYDNTYITLFRFDDTGRIELMREYFNPTVLADAGTFGAGGVPQPKTASGAGRSTADREHWARAFFTAVDTREADRIAAHFTDDIRLRFGNAEPVFGREAVKTSFSATSAALRSVHHEIRGVWSGRDGETEVVSTEADVTYEMADGRRVTVPCTSTLRLRGDLIADYRIFIDATPVFGRGAVQ
ncbi:MAG: nuclear transport factor 2 family protein [Pseudomonadota bacterium]